MLKDSSLIYLWSGDISSHPEKASHVRRPYRSPKKSVLCLVNMLRGAVKLVWSLSVVWMDALREELSWQLGAIFLKSGDPSNMEGPEGHNTVNRVFPFICDFKDLVASCTQFSEVTRARAIYISKYWCQVSEDGQALERAWMLLPTIFVVSRAMSWSIFFSQYIGSIHHNYPRAGSFDGKRQNVWIHTCFECIILWIV